jgi:nucleoside-diphosphate kinase
LYLAPAKPLPKKTNGGKILGTISQIVTEHLERTLVLIKPDGVRRGIAMEVLSRFERVGLKIVGLKMIHVDRTFAENHYTYEDIAVRHGEAIRNQLLDFITESPVVAAVIEGIKVVETVRKLCGSTEPTASPPGTIRGDYSHHGYAFCNSVERAVRNVIHASASVEEAGREVALWFPSSEIFEYRRSDQEEHLYS